MTRRRASIVFTHILLCISITVPCLAQEAAVPAAWQFIDTEGFHPSPRSTGGVFLIESQDTLGVFGGYREALALNLPGQNQNVFLNDLFLFHAPSRTWTRASSGVGPAPRALTCAVYHEASNQVFVFGGTDFAADFSAFTFFDDLWSYDLANDTWTEHFPPGPRPAARAAFGCSILGDSIYVFSGNGPLFFLTNNELWRYGIDDGTWTLLQADAPAGPERPVARTQMIFSAVPGTNQLLLHGGDAFETIPEPPFLVSVTQNDVWLYDADSNLWQEREVEDTPEIARIHQASALTSGRYLLVQNGDAQGDLTADDTCPPPLFCILPATPTDDTFVYDIRNERWLELELGGTPPPSRRSMMAKIGDKLYLFGGYDWDGENAVGVIQNPYTWELDLSTGGNWLLHSDF